MGISFGRNDVSHAAIVFIEPIIKGLWLLRYMPQKLAKNDKTRNFVTHTLRNLADKVEFFFLIQTFLRTFCSA